MTDWYSDPDLTPKITSEPGGWAIHRAGRRVARLTTMDAVHALFRQVATTGSPSRWTIDDLDRAARV
jgi:hypothetical protein